MEIIGQITDGFIVFDPNWCIQYVNQKGAEMLQRKSPSDLIGKNLWDEFPDALDRKFYKVYHTVMDKKVPAEFDEYYPKPLNRWYHARVYPLEYGISVFFHDATEKKIKEKLNDAQYEQLFEKNHDGILLLDHNGIITSVNKGFGRITGYNSNFYIGKRFNELQVIHSEDIERLMVSYVKVLNGEFQQFHLDLKHLNGSAVHCDISCFPVEVMDKTFGIFVIVHDVTQIKKLEWSLRRSEQKYRSLKNHNSEGICSLDLNGKLVGVNPALEKMSGYSKEEFLQLHLKHIFHPKDLDTLKECIQNMKKGKGIVNTFEVQMLNKNGDYLHTIMTVIPNYIEDNLEGFYLIIKDITKEKKTEEMLIRSEKLSAVGQLAASIIHEIRNPLTSLMGFLQLIEHNYGVKDEYIKIMSDELMRINFITNELLVLAKPQVKKTNWEDIGILLHDVVKLMSSQALLSGAELVLHIEDGLPKVNCDGQQLKQVFINLIKNGIEAMSGKTGSITVSAGKKDKHIVVSVKDEGIGMTEKQMKQLGEPFFTTKQKGTGLGMLMTFKIIENHNGQVQIESEVGKGTTIHVTLPISNVSNSKNRKVGE